MNKLKSCLLTIFDQFPYDQVLRVQFVVGIILCTLDYFYSGAKWLEWVYGTVGIAFLFVIVVCAARAVYLWKVRTEFEVCEIDIPARFARKLLVEEARVLYEHKPPPAPPTREEIARARVEEAAKVIEQKFGRKVSRETLESMFVLELRFMEIDEEADRTKKKTRNIKPGK